MTSPLITQSTQETPQVSICHQPQLLLLLSSYRNSSWTPILPSPLSNSSKFRSSTSFSQARHTSFFSSRFNSRKLYYSHLQRLLSWKYPTIATLLTSVRREMRSSSSGTTYSEGSLTFVKTSSVKKTRRRRRKEQARPRPQEMLPQVKVWDEKQRSFTRITSHYSSWPKQTSELNIKHFNGYQLKY